VVMPRISSIRDRYPTHICGVGASALNLVPSINIIRPENHAFVGRVEHEVLNRMFCKCGSQRIPQATRSNPIERRGDPSGLGGAVVRGRVVEPDIICDMASLE
jgi:hypothetical protein